MRALLALADGTYFEGESFGASGEAMGEVVFNTSMMGYQEILTDPSYKVVPWSVIGGRDAACLTFCVTMASSALRGSTRAR